MISQDTFMGGAVQDGTSTLLSNSERVQIFDHEGGNWDITLPDARLLKAGGPAFFILNLDNSNLDDATIKDNEGNTVVMCECGQCTQLWLINNTTQAGIWVYKITMIGG